MLENWGPGAQAQLTTSRGVRAVCHSQSMKTNVIKVRVELEPGPCSLHLPAAPALCSCSCTGIPPQSRGPTPYSFRVWPGLHILGLVPAATDQQGTLRQWDTNLPPQNRNSQRRPSSKTTPQLGWGWRGGSSHSLPQGAQGCPLEPKRPGLGAKRGPDRQARRQPQSIKIEVMLLKLKKPPAQNRRRRRWQCDRVTGSS